MTFLMAETRFQTRLQSTESVLQIKETGAFTAPVFDCYKKATKNSRYSEYTERFVIRVIELETAPCRKQ